MIDVKEQYMQRALELAAHGRGNTSPNPMVGAVVVAHDGRIIGEGYHRRCGQAHAEVNAIASVADADRHLLGESTIYVTLEPCSHWGKTPPCAQLIIDTGIRRVVVAAGDPFKEVAGRGIAMLRAAGIEVVTGVLAEESRQLNARFMTAHEQQRPWVTLKWAQSTDGYMDSDRPEGLPECFSSSLTSTLVHRLRSLHDAIAVGSGTVLADNPRLDCRLWHGRSPRPIIFDRRKILKNSDIHTTLPATIISEDSIGAALSTLYRQGITSLLVEGGATLLRAFITAGVWDIAHVETARRPLGNHGRCPAPGIDAVPTRTLQVGSSAIAIYSNNPLFNPKNL